VEYTKYRFGLFFRLAFEAAVISKHNSFVPAINDPLKFKRCYAA
jgi:hypothetical protein